MSKYLLFVVMPFALFACGAEPDGSEDDTSSFEDDNSDDNNDDTAASPEWKGTWTVTIAWEVECEMPFHDPDFASGEDSWSLVLSGPENNLTATVNGNDWYTLTGSGDEDGVFLCGKFPMHDAYDDIASTSNDNQICIKATDMEDAELGYGEASGRFEGAWGTDCQLHTSTAVFEG